MSVAIRTITRLQDADDAPSLGAGQDGYALTWDNGSGAFVATALSAGVTDHGALTGLTPDDDHTQYALLAGRAGGQTIYGDTAADGDITIHGTSNATRTTSYVLLQPTAGNVGIGTTAPATALHVVGAATVTGGIRPAANSTTALQLQNATGTAILTVDTTNARLGIGTTPGAQLHIRAGAGANPGMWMSDSDVNHPFTAVGFNPEISSTVVAVLSVCSGTNGGLGLSGLSKTDSVGAGVFGYVASASPANPAIVLGGWKTNGTTGRTAMTGADKIAQFLAGNAAVATVQANGRIGILTDAPAAQLHVDQSSSTGAVPVLTVDQADVSEEFIRFIGTSTTDASQSLVDAADRPTPGALVGWLKIYVQDDQATNPITDGSYFVPFYAAPAA